MPPVRRQNIGRRTRNASRVNNLRSNETEKERRHLLEANRMRNSKARSTTAPEESIQSTKRVQFLVRLTFAMSINKPEGQSLEMCGINFELSCFAHGQSANHRRYLFSLHMEKTKNIVHYKAL